MFITFEGGEGSGKTTLIAKLKQALVDLGYDVVTTREPGGSSIAEKIRHILLDNDNTAIKAHTEALLFAASRAQHLDEIILPALSLNKLVLCDRYLDSSLAYQAYGRDLGEDFVRKVNTYAIDHLPNLTFYIDLDPRIGLGRVNQNRSDKKDRLDLETYQFHEKVRQGYLELVKHEERIVKIDGTLSPNEIFTQVLTKIKERL